MGQSHIIPFLALALLLEQRTKYKNITIFRSWPPSDHGLPPNTENTDIIPYDLVIRLIQSPITMRPAFKQLIQTILDQHQQKLCIIADIFFGWTVSVAKELGVFHVIFSGSGGYGMACYYSLWMNLPHRRVDSDNFSLPDFPEARDIHRTQLTANMSEADGTDAGSLFQRENLSE
ncbi:hypothetical protein VNO77_29111 [Canavalia gladiata]|uniref:Uncharacterized protein n=1 Tax=Canavalia gladiata TaxID=3824 RepID=A0AAN9KZY9_CANGL